MSIDKQWIKAGNIPEKLACSSIIALSDKEIICASEYGNVIYKFHMDEAEYKWQEWMKTPAKYGQRHHQLAVNKSKDKMYWYGNNSMYILDLKSKQWTRFKLAHDVIQHYIFPVNNSIHCVGGDEFALHRIWDDSKKKFTVFHDFNEYQYIRDACCVYIPTKQVILLIGGQTDWRQRKLVGCVWQCSLKTGKWTKISDIVFNYYHVSAILSGDERHVIISGGVSASGTDSDAIYVLDICDDGKYVLRKSDIVCPKAGENHLVMSGRIKSELLVFGYVNRLFRTDSFVTAQNPSVSIVQMINMYHSKLMVHWISRTSRYGYFSDTDNNGSSGRYEHYMIPLKNIIKK